MLWFSTEKKPSISLVRKLNNVYYSVSCTVAILFNCLNCLDLKLSLLKYNKWTNLKKHTHICVYLMYMLWFKFVLGLMFFELVSVLFAIAPHYGNEYTTKENKN